MNTRNAFYGLDENLRALAPKYDPPSTISSFTVSKNLQKKCNIMEVAFFREIDFTKKWALKINIFWHFF